MLRQIFTNTCTELLMHGSYEPLKIAIDDYTAEAFDEYYLITEYISNNNVYRSLCDYYKREKEKGQKQLKQLNDQIMDMEGLIHVCSILKSILLIHSILFVK